MLNWIVWNRTVYMDKNGFGFKYSAVVDMPSNKTKQNQTPKLIDWILFNFFFVSLNAMLRGGWVFKNMFSVSTLKFFTNCKKKIK